MERILKALIRLYQLTLSPWVGRECRFVPSCSNYAMEAIDRHGALKGLYLAIRRILRCHPLGGRGWDPVPSQFHWRHTCSACPPEKDDTHSEPHQSEK